jgi:hypothetical protein
MVLVDDNIIPAVPRHFLLPTAEVQCLIDNNLASISLGPVIYLNRHIVRVRATSCIGPICISKRIIFETVELYSWDTPSSQPSPLLRTQHLPARW